MQDHRARAGKGVGMRLRELDKAAPGDNVAQDRKRLDKILLAKWNKKLDELE